MPWDRVHDEAEVLEHYISEDLEERIADGARRSRARSARRPDPGARPDDRRPTTTVALAELEPGRRRRSSRRVSDGDPEMLRYPRPARDPPGVRARGPRRASRSAARSSSRSAAREHALGPELAARMRVAGGDASERPASKEAIAPAPRPPERRRRRPDGHSTSRPSFPGEAAVADAARRSLDGHRRGLRAALALPRPGVHRLRSPTSTPATSRPTSPPARKFGYLLLWVVLAREPDRDGGPDAVGEARDRDRQEPARALPREVLPAQLDRPLDPGRGGRDGDRHRRGRRRRARAQPAVRDPAVPGGADRRRRRVRDPRAPAAGLPPARGRDRGPRRASCSSRSGSRSSTPKPNARRRRRPPVHPGLRRHREHPARHRHPRRDGDAARRLPALGADPAARSSAATTTSAGGSCGSRRSTW